MSKKAIGYYLAMFLCMVITSIVCVDLAKNLKKFETEASIYLKNKSDPTYQETTDNISLKT